MDKASARDYLFKCDALYQSLLNYALRLERAGHDEAALKWVSVAAGVAWMGHGGRFADGRLEGPALRIGRKLPHHPPQKPRESGAPVPTSASLRVLHIATSVYEFGGHSRLIENWLINDPDSEHSLFLTDQRELIPKRLSQRFELNQNRLVVVPAESATVEKAKRLREFAAGSFGLVVLHHHPDDTVPLVAFANEGGPPVVVMNHADHVFWLGSSIADAVIDFREFGTRLSIERRSIPETFLLPLCLNATATSPDKKTARRLLGIPDDEVMLLTIGSAYKFSPTETYNFFNSMKKILDRNPSAHLYVIGVSDEEININQGALHKQIHLLGVVPNPITHQSAADLYLDSFPYGSTTALLETALCGAAPVLQYSPNPQQDQSGEAGLKGFVKKTSDEGDYVEYVSHLINSPNERRKLGHAVADSIAESRSGRAWLARVQAIYRSVGAVAHKPRMVPANEPETSDVDLNLSSFNQARSKTALLQRVPSNTFARLNLPDVMRLFLLSVLKNDTRTLYQLQTWLGLFKSRLMAPPRRMAADDRSNAPQIR